MSRVYICPFCNNTIAPTDRAYKGYCEDCRYTWNLRDCGTADREDKRHIEVATA